MTTARATESFLSTRPKRTRPAPTSASVIVNSTASAAPSRTAWPRGNTRRASHTSASTESRHRPLVTRWVNSMIVAAVGLRGTSSP
jgi:hypothetical protein